MTARRHVALYLWCDCEKPRDGCPVYEPITGPCRATEREGPAERRVGLEVVKPGYWILDGTMWASDSRIGLSDRRAARSDGGK